jgi:hypothetical protein
MCQRDLSQILVDKNTENVRAHEKLDKFDT